ncbi:MAG TPA: MFS transporter [Acidimicrobiales bacterium]
MPPVVLDGKGTADEDAPRQHYRVTFGVLAIGTLAYVLMQTMVLPALATIQHDLHTSESAVAWLLSAFLVSASVATPILGRLGDMFGKEKMLVVVFAVLAAGTVLGGIAGSLWLLIVARVIQGVAGAVFPLSFGIIRDEFPTERVAGGIGLISALLGIGSGVGLIVGGPVVQHLSYHWLFWFPLVLVLAALVATIRYIPESPVKTAGKLDVPGAVLLSVWLITVLVGVTEGPVWGWGSAGVIGLFAATVVFFVIWVRVELRARQPLVDMRMMRIPTVWWTNVAALLFGVGMYASIVVLPPFVETPARAGYGFGASATMAGVFLVPSAAGTLLAGLYNGRITAAIGAKGALVLSGVASAIPFGVLAVAHGSPWEVYAASALSGLGLGLGFAALTNLVVDAVPATVTGIATGMNANIRTIGGAVGSQIVASILTAGVLASGYPSQRSYAIAFGFMAAAFLLATVAAIVVPASPQGVAGPEVGGDSSRRTRVGTSASQAMEVR